MRPGLLEACARRIFLDKVALLTMGVAMATIRDALRKAAADSKFGTEFMTNPEKFRREYELTDQQITGIKAAATAYKANTNEKDFTYIG